MNLGSSPMSDGITVEFYKKTLETAGPSLIENLNYAFTVGES